MLSKDPDVEFRHLGTNGSVTLLLEKKPILKGRGRGETRSEEFLDHACFRNFGNCRLGVDRQNTIFFLLFWWQSSILFPINKITLLHLHHLISSTIASHLTLRSNILFQRTTYKVNWLTERKPLQMFSFLSLQEICFFSSIMRIFSGWYSAVTCCGLYLCKGLKKSKKQSFKIFLIFVWLMECRKLRVLICADWNQRVFSSNYLAAKSFWTTTVTTPLNVHSSYLNSFFLFSLQFSFVVNQNEKTISSHFPFHTNCERKEIDMSEFWRS